MTVTSIGNANASVNANVLPVRVDRNVEPAPLRSGLDVDTVVRIAAMWPFGKKKQSRFVDEASFEKNLESQTTMAPQTVAELHRIGVRLGAPLRLEYFFYANSSETSEALARALIGKGYSSECRPSDGGSPLLCITGWSTPISIDEETVVAWTDGMCRLGYSHDCEFDGWGTNPEQPELQN